MEQFKTNEGTNDIKEEVKEQQPCTAEQGSTKLIAYMGNVAKAQKIGESISTTTGEQLEMSLDGSEQLEIDLTNNNNNV